jgi:hypothetical protein
LNVAAQRLERKAALARASVEQHGRARAQLRRDLGYAEGVFDLVEVRLHLFGRELCEPVLVRPFVEHRLGDAKADTAGEQRRTADAAPHRDVDRRTTADADGRAERRVAKQMAHRLARAHLLIDLGLDVRAFFQHHHVEARIGQRARDHGAGRARADDDGVADLGWHGAVGDEAFSLHAVARGTIGRSES